MSWPVPDGASPSLPVVSLPWAGRELRRPQLVIAPNKRCRASRKASVYKLKYGIAMMAGFAVVRLAKGVVNCIPIVNVVTRPILDLFPTILVGPALGTAVMYGIEQGDLFAARHRVRDAVHHMGRELNVIVQDLSSEVQPIGPEVSRAAGALEDVARAVTDSVAELERTVIPVTEREYRRLEAHVRRAVRDYGGDDASAGRGWGGRPCVNP
ncbi:hypothetical protein VaNZ11_014338 [Volvox africanus]|uniref:Uncharacterized protein n=1 Tax=Volvox africanus TaxID=51714 RepID=A0ABQ5SI70_9CHLO|nr:hypothetical protein VaNZ11_014338 [Volvox africanus]